MNYPKVRLSSICDIQIGRTPSRNNSDYWGKGYPWASISDMHSGKYLKSTKEEITDKGFAECKCKLVPTNTILLSFKLSIGKVSITRFPVVTNEAIASLAIIEDNRVYRDYLYWSLKSIDLTKGSDKAVKGLTLNKRKLQEVEVPLPTLMEQKRIADLLDRADSLRQKRRESLALLDDFLKSVFIDMFGDPVSNEKGWEVRRLGELTRIGSGGTPSRNNLEYFRGNIPWVKTGEVNFNMISDTEEKISEDALLNSNCTLLPIDTILVALYGQGLTRGRSSLLKIKATTNQACAAVLPSNMFDPYYMWYVIILNYENLRSLSRGGNQPNLNLSFIKEMKVINPPLTLQKSFAKYFEQVHRTSSIMIKNFSEMDNQFNALLQRAFINEQCEQNNNFHVF